jgi:UDP-N-acetylbacillosamine N-acetyltransferase
VSESARQGLLILGLGGHARSVADLALSLGYQSLLFVDDNAAEGERVLEFATQREFKGPLPAGWSCLPASGDNQRRWLQVQSALAAGWPLATLISPHASVGVGSLVSPGCFIGHHAHVGPMARIGTACILNTGAIVDHECIIGHCVHISVNATVAGRCRVGDFVFLGAGATVIDGTTIAGDVTVGAGGVVTESIDLPGTYVGIPARLLIDSK